METVFLSIFFSFISKEFSKPAPSYRVLILSIIVMLFSLAFAVILIKGSERYSGKTRLINRGVGYLIVTAQLLILSRIIYLEEVVPTILSYLF